MFAQRVLFGERNPAPLAEAVLCRTGFALPGDPVRVGAGNQIADPVGLIRAAVRPAGQIAATTAQLACKLLQSPPLWLAACALQPVQPLAQVGGLSIERISLGQQYCKV